MDGILNENIKKFREFRGLTQEELAFKIKKSKNVISNWERTDNNPDIDSVERICVVLNVTPNQLFGWEPCEAYEKYAALINEKLRKLRKLEDERDNLQKIIDKLSFEIKEEEYKRRE